MGSIAKNRVDYTYEGIKRQIMALTLHPGELINISRLAEELSVSRTPIREALGMLERDGLVVRLSEGGYRVRQVSLRDVKEAFSVQAHLEVMAVKLAIPRLNEAGRANLESILDAARKALEAGDFNDLNRLGMDFHVSVVEASGNRTLARIHRNLVERLLHLSRISYMREGRVHLSHREHDDIFDAIIDGDVSRAEVSVRQHLDNAIQNVMGLVSEYGDSAVVTWPADEEDITTAIRG